MAKCRILGKFTDLVREHRFELEALESEKGSLSHWDILRVWTESSSPYARNFCFVLGSMTGSEAMQYNKMLESLRKSGEVSLATTLEIRRSLPCIDVQESLWLLNRDSNRDRSKSYGYRDYQKFAGLQYISGTAKAFLIDWNLIPGQEDPMGSTPDTATQELVRATKQQANSRAVEAATSPTEASFQGFRQMAFEELVVKFGHHLELKDHGWWQSARSEDLWNDFCLQIMVAQATPNGQELIYRKSEAWTSLQLSTLLPALADQGAVALRSILSHELTANGMRMANVKAKYLLDALSNPRIVTNSGEFILLEAISHLWEKGNTEEERYYAELNARDTVRSIVYGFGNKSASDFLLEVGYAERLVALDIRVTKILRQLGLRWIQPEAVQQDSRLYQSVQNFLFFQVCPKAGITPRILDRMCYQRNQQIMNFLKE